MKTMTRTGSDEAHAFLLAAKHFSGVVPKTWLEGGDSVQQHVSWATAAAHRDDLADLMSTADAIDGLAAMAALDVVICNGDRHPCNWLVSDSGAVFAIDNVFGESVEWADILRPAHLSGVFTDRARGASFLSSLRDYLREYEDGSGASLSSEIEDVAKLMEKFDEYYEP